MPVSPYPAYAALLCHNVLPLPTPLAPIIMFGQLLVGLGVLTGTYTRAALLAGIFMNLNFVAAGAPTPSAFYLVIQAALLAGGAGVVFSVDRWWASRRVRDPLAFMTALEAPASSKRRVRHSIFFRWSYCPFSPSGRCATPTISAQRQRGRPRDHSGRGLLLRSGLRVDRLVARRRHRGGIPA